MKPTIISNEIAQLAYLMWEKDGRPSDRDQFYWLEAEKQLAKKPTPGPEGMPAAPATTGTGAAKKQSEPSFAGMRVNAESQNRPTARRVAVGRKPKV